MFPAGRYRLLAPLGSGAFGSVSRALDTITGEPVAIKRIADAGRHLQRIRREIAAPRHLRIPGVVRLFDP